MASGSSSTNMDFPRANGSTYDVFLSFRGLDTRHSFADHLYEKLVQAGILTFRDNDEINKGEELKPEIKQAIKASEASIIVLSKNYAKSTWCLDELWLILEQRRECNHFVLPIFYHVYPSDVRKQHKTFNIKVKTSTRWTNDNVNRWKTALTKVSNISGLVLNCGSETKFLRDIVDTIYNKLDSKQVYLPPNLVGMDARLQELNFWVKESDANFVVICGMGGSGKSTLAQCIVYSNWQYFENISIIERIGSRCKEPHDLLQLREQLFKDILGGKKRRIPDVCQGAFQIEEVLQNKHALIVLDDIVKPSQLNALLGAGNINQQSKIIITTNEQNIGTWFKSTSRRYHEYKMKLLDDDESLELLSLHAFGSKITTKGYEELTKEVVRYCEGNPLALEVLGSSLSENNSISSWRSALNLLGKDIHRDIYSVLKKSYDWLPFDSDRELFLHIACFFVGMDEDYVVTILERDYCAESRIRALTKRCLLYVTPNKKVMMHRLLQEMGRSLVDRESPMPAERSRVWRNMESYDILIRGESSTTIKGLALDLQILKEEDEFKWKASKGSQLRETTFSAESLPLMDQLKFLQLHDVRFEQSKKDFAEHLRWLCWVGFYEATMPSHLCMGNMVALDMSYSSLKEFEPPMVLQFLKILNFKSSPYLEEINLIFRLPNLETLILCNCHRLIHVCKTIENLTSLALLNMTGCENLRHSFSLPHSLKRLFLKDCNLECTDDFSLSFSDQSFLEYLNLGNSLFELLPSYNHLKILRVLDLSLCSRLHSLSLPSTLAELYIYHCESLEKVTFESHRFTLQEFGYEGCSNLLEIEGFIKLVPLAKLDEVDLGHMKWLKEYQNYELCLAGDDELMKGRSLHLQMLYEFNILSISLPDIKDPNMMPEYISKSTSLSFDVPSCPKNRRLKGLNVTFKYTISNGDSVWFAKIKTSNGVDLMYNPKVFGKPEFGGVAIWLSYWPIGNKLNVGDSVSVSIVVMNRLEIYECGASLVYIDDDVANDTLQNYNMEWVETLGGDLSRFQLSTGACYLCRRDFFELMEVGRLTPGWLSIIVGDTIDDTEVRGWRKTGRPQQSYQSFTELKTVRCIVYGPPSEEIYRIPEMSKSSFVEKSMEFTSTILEETRKSETTSEISDTKTKGLVDEPPFAFADRYKVAPPWREPLQDGVCLSHETIFNDYFVQYLEDAIISSGLLLTNGIARASIIVLSESYTRSFFCLEKLRLILAHRKEFNYFVLPVFYHLEPSHIIQHGKDLWQGFKDKRKVELWLAALKEVANMPNIYIARWSRNDDDSAGIREIVSIVKHAFNPNISC